LCTHLTSKATFTPPHAPDVWIPFQFDLNSDSQANYFQVAGRLKPGVPLGQAQLELNVIAHWLQQQYPNDDKDRGLRLMPLTTALLGDQRSVLGMMLGAVGFVLLIGCANIANLQLVRSRVRQKEMALRAALGASPQRIVRQLLAENVVLGLAGGVVGVLLAFWGVAWIVAKGPTGVPRLDESSVDASTLAFAEYGLPTVDGPSTRLVEPTFP